MIRSMNKTPAPGKPTFRKDTGPIPTTWAKIKFSQKVADLLLLEKVTYKDIVNLQVSVLGKVGRDELEDVANYWSTLDMQSVSGITMALTYFVDKFKTQN